MDANCETGPSLACAVAVGVTVLGWLPAVLGVVALIIATMFYVIGIWESVTVRAIRERRRARRIQP